MQALILVSLLVVSAEAFLFGGLGGGCTPCGGGFPQLQLPQLQLPTFQLPNLFPQQSYAQPSYAQPSYAQAPVYQPEYAPAPVSHGYVMAPQGYQQPEVYQPQSQYQPEPSYQAPQPTYQAPSSYLSAPYQPSGGYEVSYSQLTRGAPLGTSGYPNTKYVSIDTVAHVPEQVAPVIHAENGYVQPAAEVQPLTSSHTTEVVAEQASYQPTHVEEPAPQPVSTYHETAPVHVAEVHKTTYNAISTPEEAGY